MSTERNRSNFFPLENFHQNRPDFDVSPLLFLDLRENRREGQTSCGGSCTRIPRDVLSDSAHAERNGTHLVPTFLYEPFLKGCLYRSNRQEFNPFETFDRARYRFRWTSYPPVFFFLFFPIVLCHFHESRLISARLQVSLSRFQISRINRINPLRSSSIS